MFATASANDFADAMRRLLRLLGSAASMSYTICVIG
jgi:hypothetical protein